MVGFVNGPPPSIPGAMPCHNGPPTFGTPAQPVVPCASNAARPPIEPAYRTPFATAGVEVLIDTPGYDHKRAHVTGVPVHPLSLPVAENTSRSLFCAVM